VKARRAQPGAESLQGVIVELSSEAKFAGRRVRDASIGSCQAIWTIDAGCLKSCPCRLFRHRE
jgi:hypothetical protein